MILMLHSRESKALVGILAMALAVAVVWKNTHPSPSERLNWSLRKFQDLSRRLDAGDLAAWRDLRVAFESIENSKTVRDSYDHLALMSLAMRHLEQMDDVPLTEFGSWLRANVCKIRFESGMFRILGQSSTSATASVPGGADTPR